ncbi:hypothetical protein U3516DRAFT_862998 [Neocallimastix sp. 'constans']
MIGSDLYLNIPIKINYNKLFVNYYTRYLDNKDKVLPVIADKEYYDRNRIRYVQWKDNYYMAPLNSGYTINLTNKNFNKEAKVPKCVKVIRNVSNRKNVEYSNLSSPLDENSKGLLPPTLFMPYGFKLSILYRVHFDIVDSLIVFKRCPKCHSYFRIPSKENFINSMKSRIDNSRYFENEKIDAKKINYFSLFLSNYRYRFIISSSSNLFCKEDPLVKAIFSLYNKNNISNIDNNELQNCVKQFVQEDDQVIPIAEERIFYSNVIPEISIISPSQFESLLPELSDLYDHVKDISVYHYYSTSKDNEENNNIIVYGVLPGMKNKPYLLLNRNIDGLIIIPNNNNINYICNKISNLFSNAIIHFQVYIKNLLQKIRKFLVQKRKSPNFKPDKFVKIVINHINTHKVNTLVGILEVQSIGEPVTQSALSYFHKLAGDDTINVEFYLKPENYDEDSKERILNSFKYINLKDIVLDIVYDGFNLRFYLYSYTVFVIRLHPLIIHQIFKQYLKDSNSILGKWNSSFNLENLYIEFKNPSSKILDWLDSNEDILCVYKVKENCPNNNLLSDNEQNKNEWKYEEKFHIQNKNDEESHIEIKNESNITNDSLLNYFKINNLTFEEKENYITLYNIFLTGTKGVKTVSSKMLGEEEFYVEVVGRNLDPIFKNQYVDLDSSRYTVYGTSKQVYHNTRKQNILTQLKRITNIDKSY